VSATVPAGGHRRCLADIDVLILAGGLGTRLGDTLGPLPKVLAPVAGRPFLDHLLAWLEGFGARRIVLALGHKSDRVIAHVEAMASPLALVPLVEPRPLGTAGALRFARPSLESDPVLVLNGDSFVDADLCALVAAHRERGAAISMLCAQVPDCGRYGRVETSGRLRFERFAEKDEARPGPGLINAGVYLFAASVLDEIARGDAASLERDVLAKRAPGSIALVAGPFRFIDIGTPESLRAADQVLLRPSGRKRI
jgi:NDP-sugar pyrophosphorylase family protein